MNPYETAACLHQYLVFHYASGSEQFPYPFGGADALEFPRRCVSEGIDLNVLPADGRGLDVGCSVGRASFELARHCSQVIGIDDSESFIKVAQHLKEEGTYPAMRLDEGRTTTRLSASVPDGIDRCRVSFEQGNAQHIRPDIGQFDVVMACNLICRLPEPLKLIGRLPKLLKPGGQLFITTPFSWLEEYTQEEHWLNHGGQDSFSSLQVALEPDFELDDEWNMPFLIREHARKFQYSVAQASRWIRK